MVDAALSGKEVTVNDTKTYNNGVKVVPSYLLKPVVVDKSNWEKMLIDERLLQALADPLSEPGRQARAPCCRTDSPARPGSCRTCRCE